MVNKIITIPNLKDHKSAGVTVVKNMSHGMNNNVARSHIGAIYRLGGRHRATSATPSSRRRSISGQSLRKQPCTSATA